MRKLLLFFSFFSLLFSEESNYYEATVFAGEPNSIVEECVSTITGDFFIHQDAHVVKGHEPIRIKERYYSRDGTNDVAGWKRNSGHEIMWVMGEYPDPLYFQIPEKQSGLRFNYTYNKDGIYRPSEFLGKGLTNCSTGKISARLNLWNNRAYKKKGDEKEIIVEGADQSVRYYRSFLPIKEIKKKKDPRKFVAMPYHLHFERLPNGNVLEYHWDQVKEKPILKTIISKSPSGREYSRVNFINSTAIGSDNRAITWHHDEEIKHDTKTYQPVTKISFPDRPVEEYTYWGSETKGIYLARKKLPENRELNIHFYQLHFNEGTNVHIHGKDAYTNPIYKRVKFLKKPVGENTEPITTHKFFYTPGEYANSDGHTEVYDAYDNLTRYHYNKSFLLTDVEHWIQSSSRVFTEAYDWSERNWLRSKTIIDDRGKAILSRTYHYDTKGNLEQENLLGNLTGYTALDGLKLEERKVDPQGADCYSIKRSFYSNNLLRKEEFPNGEVIEYFYHEDTDLIAKKFVYDERTGQRLRTFYVYNDTILNYEYTDNGTGANHDDLRGVTNRLIKRIQHRQDDFLYGFPEVIEEKYLDLETKKEVLLKKKVIHYERKGNIASVDYYDANDQLRYTLTYTYDDFERLIKQTDPENREHVYEYDANYNPVFWKDPNEEFDLIQKYDFMNRPQLTIHKTAGDKARTSENKYNYLNQKVQEIDFRGNSTYYEYDPFDHPTLVEKPTLYDSEGNSFSPKITKTYNSLGKVATETDGEGNTTSILYTSRGDPYQITHPDGSIESYTYDLSGNVISHTATLGTRTTYAYDFLDRTIEKKIFSPEGDLLSDESYSYDTFNLLEYTAPDGIKTCYSYDGAGRKIQEKVLSETPRETFYEYDELGRLARIAYRTDENAFQVHVKEYDLLDRVIKEIEQDQNGVCYSETRYKYDDYSNQVALIKEVQVGESVEQTSYDPFKRPVKIIDPLENVTTIDYDDFYQNSYGKKVLKKTTTHPKGTQTIEIFDTHDNLSVLEQLDASGKTLLREELFYNNNDQKIKQISTLFASNRKIIKTWEYNDRSRLVALHEGVKVTQYSYDTEGNLLQLLKPSGLSIYFTYDALGQKTSIEASDGSCHHMFTHDLMGNITQAKDLLTSRSTIRDYNHFGDVVYEKLENGYALRKTYDALGRKTVLILPDDSKIEYVYDSYHLQAVRRFTAQGELFYEHSYTNYDLSHNLLSEKPILSLGNIEHEVDLLGRRIKTTSPYTHEEAHLDAHGNLEELQSGKYRSIFKYDPLDQLTSEKGRVNHTYDFDAHYERLDKDGYAYHTNSLHELEKTYDSEYLYDPDGNRAQENQTTYKFDALDRLTEISSPSEIYHFYYDAWNRLITQDTSTYSYLSSWTHKTEEFLFDDRNELGSFPNELRILGQGRGAEIGATIAIEKDQTIYAPTHDLFGNITGLINQNGSLSESYYYSAFGEETFISPSYIYAASPPLNPWRYQSKRKIGNHVNFGRRFYDPKVGRFLSPDPKGFDEGPNLYQFALNNPFVNIDLYGEYVCSYFSNDYDNFPSSNLFRPSNELLENLMTTAYNSPRFQGGIEALGGLAEAGIGAGVTLGTHGFGSGVGWPIMAHGLDHFFTGLRSIVTGSPDESATSQLLQKTGMSPNSANIVDSSLSIAGSIYGINSILNANNAYLNTGTFFNPKQDLTTDLFQENLKLWPSSSKGRQILNGLEYSSHALDRMSPYGLIQNGTEIISRGVPPSVVENAIKFGKKIPGNTSNEVIHIFENVRIVTNSEGNRIVTVIKTGN